MTLYEQVQAGLINQGFTQWRHDTGARRGELSGSYRNYNLDMNVILYGCTYDIRSLSSGELLVKRGDQFDLMQAIKRGQLAA